MNYTISLHDSGLHVHDENGKLVDIYQLTSLSTCILKINHFIESDISTMRIYDLLFFRNENSISVYNKNTDTTVEYTVFEIKSILHKLDTLITIFN